MQSRNYEGVDCFPFRAREMRKSNNEENQEVKIEKEKKRKKKSQQVRLWIRGTRGWAAAGQQASSGRKFYKANARNAKEMQKVAQRAEKKC